MNWRPIETAPMDETVILGYIPGHAQSVIPIAFYGSTVFSGWHTAGCCFFDESTDCDPTHWMPLPEEPK